MRLFTAIDIPEQIRHELGGAIARLRESAVARWNHPDKLHITTKFIGEWPEPRLEELKAGLSALPPRAPLSIHIRELGFFPNPRSPRVFWCGIDAPGLDALAAATDRGCAALGIASENRPFSPHLTLARIKERVNLEPLREAMAALPDRDFGKFEVRGFFLYLSKLRPTGSVYTKLAEFPFSK